MNQTMETILNRRSYRSYLDKKVDDEKLLEIAKAGTFAASGMNKQSAQIIIVKDQTILETFRKIGTNLRGKDPFYNAKHLILVFASTTSRLYIQDGSLVLGNMMLAAESLGLGSCWINCIQDILDTDEGRVLKEKLDLTSDLIAIGSIIVGYYDGDKLVAKPRKADYIKIV